MNKSIHLLTLFNVRITFTPLCVISLSHLNPATHLARHDCVQLDSDRRTHRQRFVIVLMFVTENIHQLGHAWAAKSVGYPMIGIRHFSWFSGSIYPKDELPLPPMTHIKRALGGFWINILIGLALAPLAFYLWTLNGVAAFTVVATSVWNLFVLGLGALLPIDFNGFTVDGGTIVGYWKEMNRDKVKG